MTVNKNGDLYEMDFLAYPLEPIEITKEMIEAIGAVPKEAYMGRDLLCIFDEEDIVRQLKPDMDKLKQNHYCK